MLDRKDYRIKQKGMIIDLTISEVYVIETLLNHNTKLGASYDELSYALFEETGHNEYIEKVIKDLKTKGIITDEIKNYGYKLRKRI